MRSRPLILSFALLTLALAAGPAAAAVSNRVLIIGVDGAGGGYTQTANMPNLDALAAAGSARYDWLNEGALTPNPPEGYGASGVNWSTITTGASAPHHGVVDNSFGGNHFDEYPFFFKYLKQKDPTLYTASIVDWNPINTEILDPQYADLVVGGVDDNVVTSTAVDLLTNGDPDAIFLHFDQVDHAGHSLGWGTAGYYAALQNVDSLIGNVMTALNARPGVVNGDESWLVMMTSDHGGQGTSHFASQGLINWQVPFVISGPAIADGATLPQGTLRDLVPTALWHLGVDPFSTPVDGHVVGLPFGSPNGIVGDLNQDGLVSGNGQGPAATDDVTAFVQGWLTSNHPTVAQSYFSGDLNLDRTTDLKDWIILNKLNPALAQSALAGLAIPEPAAGGLATLAVATIAAYRRRHISSRSRLSAKSLAFITAPLALALAATTITPVHAALTDNLVALYEFDGNFLDTSGSPQPTHGTPVNSPQFAPGKIGQGMSLTGVKDYMSLNPVTLTELNFGTTTDFSISMWIRQDDFVSDPAVLSNKNWATGDNVGVNWAVKGHGIFDLNTKGSAGTRLDLDTAQNSATLGVGVWSHVLMTIDRDGPTKLYVNGVNTGTINLSSPGTFNGALPWNIGQDGTGNYGVEFTGAVDELAFWRRSLTPTEAGQLWNAGAGVDLGAQVVDSRLRLVIDRDSGAMTIKNNTGAPQPIIGYEITSDAGTFNRSGWQPIAGRLDDAGNGTVDPDDDWVVLTAANSLSDLSEVSLGAGALANGSSVNLGSGIWTKYYQDSSDVEFLYADGVGDEPLTGLIEFTGNGGASYPRGDVNFDGRLDSDDWSNLATLFGSNLAGKSIAQQYRLGDLNGDGAHTLDDVLQFRLDYDAANGLGAFEAITSAVPEPTSLALLAVTALALSFSTSRRSRLSASPRRTIAVAGTLLTAACLVAEARATILLQQNFNGIPLGPHVDETDVVGANVWSKTPPAGWSIDDSGMPAGGVTEWRGWSFADPAWWSAVAGDQGRSQFAKGTGVVAIADPDEWDDLSHDAGTYNSFLNTPAISLAGVGVGAAQLRFDSSWMPEGVQTATVTVSYNGGAATEVLRWESEGGNQAFFKAANTNETVAIPLNNPAGATTMTLSFGMTNAGNNWFWAVDNLVAFTPLTLQVDATTGAMKILGDASFALTGYEIVSPNGSLNPTGWKAGNLDAQNVGAPSPAAADFNNTGGVNAADLALWKTAFGTSANADADGDNDSDGADFLRWQRQFGQTSDAGSTWLTLLGTESKLIESYLQGSSTFATDRTIGAGFDVSQGTRDLQFTYTTLAGEKATGFVQYVNLPAVAAIPEPTAAALLSIASLGLLLMRPRVSIN